MITPMTTLPYLTYQQITSVTEEQIKTFRADAAQNNGPLAVQYEHFAFAAYLLWLQLTIKHRSEEDEDRLQALIEKEI